MFEKHVSPLPLQERIKLAAMILENSPYRPGANYSEEWTEEDIREFTAHSLSRLIERLEDEEQQHEAHPG